MQVELINHRKRKNESTEMCMAQVCELRGTMLRQQESNVNMAVRYTTDLVCMVHFVRGK